MTQPLTSEDRAREALVNKRHVFERDQVLFFCREQRKWRSGEVRGELTGSYFDVIVPDIPRCVRMHAGDLVVQCCEPDGTCLRNAQNGEEVAIVRQIAIPAGVLKKPEPVQTPQHVKLDDDVMWWSEGDALWHCGQVGSFTEAGLAMVTENLEDGIAGYKVGLDRLVVQRRYVDEDGVSRTRLTQASTGHPVSLGGEGIRLVGTEP